MLKGESPARIAFLRSIVETLPSPLEAVPGEFERLVSSAPEELNATLAETTDKNTRSLLTALLQMPEEDRHRFALAEHTYAARCREDVFLTFYDTRTSSKDILPLPEDKMYTVEILDVWEMTREVICTGASGQTKISLPGKEGIAVLATRETDQK